MDKEFCYKISSRRGNLKVSIELYPPKGYEKTKDFLRRYSGFEAVFEFSNYEDSIKLHYPNEDLDEMFRKVNNSERSIETLLGLNHSEHYSFEYDKLLMRCLLTLEDKLIKKLGRNSPPLILDGDSGAS